MGEGGPRMRAVHWKCGWMNYTWDNCFLFIFSKMGKCIFGQYALQFVWLLFWGKLMYFLMLQPTYAFLQWRCCRRSSNGVAWRVHRSKDLTVLCDSIEEEELCTRGLNILCPILTFCDAWDVTLIRLQIIWRKFVKNVFSLINYVLPGTLPPAYWHSSRM